MFLNSTLGRISQLAAENLLVLPQVQFSPVENKCSDSHHKFLLNWFSLCIWCDSVAQNNKIQKIFFNKEFQKVVMHVPVKVQELISLLWKACLQ